MCVSRNLSRKSYKCGAAAMLPFSTFPPETQHRRGSSGNRGAAPIDDRHLYQGRPAPRARSMIREGNPPMAQSDTPADTPANQERHWQRTTNLMLTHLGIWFFFGYIIHMFVNVLNKVAIPILGFPVGYYMDPYSALNVFVDQLFE